ncbi:MAG TPA: GNAT family N-acetyltransferase [Lachnospiraceae bacterium]|nr:GNAT family N-acetyltransferase [Lachnospiraceae bacterium]
MEYRESINVDDYQNLREMVGWLKLTREQAESGILHSAYGIGCYEGNTMIGMARIVWDRGYIAYLSDVVVSPQYQGRGIGKQLVEKTMEYIKSQLKEGWKIKIVLEAAKGKEGFYRKFGFAERPNEQGGPGMDIWIK